MNAKEIATLQHMQEQIASVQADLEDIVRRYPTRDALLQSDLPDLEKIKIVHKLNYVSFAAQFIVSKRMSGEVPESVMRLMKKIREQDGQIKKLEANQ